MKRFLIFLCLLISLPVYAGLFDDLVKTDAEVIKYVEDVGYNHAYDDILGNKSLDKNSLKIDAIAKRNDILVKHLVDKYDDKTRMKYFAQLDNALQDAINQLATINVVYVPVSVSDFSKFAVWNELEEVGIRDELKEVKPDRVQYGYNAQGNYVPTSIGNQQIQYGFNAVGDYVPMSVGGRHINYGYNAVGDYVPLEY